MMCRHPFAARIVRIICALALLPWLLGGCSLLRMTYPQLPTIAYWWFDGYVDFNAAQTRRVQEQLSDWLRWNRSTQLGDYAALLQRARAEVLADTTPARACQWFDDVVTRAMTGLEQALPAAAEVALALSPAQMEHLQQRLDKRNADLRDDFLQPTREERLKESTRRVVERAETLYGRIDDEQRAAIARGVAASPFDPERWIIEQQQRQRDLIDMLRRLQAESASNEQMQAALRVLAERAQHSPSESYRAYQRRLTQYNCAFAARIHNTTTPAQRQAAAATLAGWESDLRTLAAEAAR